MDADKRLCLPHCSRLMRGLPFIVLLLVAPVLQASSLFQDGFDSVDGDKWFALDRPAAPFMGVQWRKDHVQATGGADSRLALTLDRNGGANGKEFASGAYQSRSVFGGGIRAEAQIQVAAGDGLVTAMFLYAKTNNGKAHRDEIDIEFLGKDPTKVQFNYFAEGQGGHEAVVDLGFDASQALHTYAFETANNVINWYVDDELKYSAAVNGPLDPGQLLLDLWAPDADHEGVLNWAGQFTGDTATALFDNVQISSVKTVNRSLTSARVEGIQTSPVPLPPAVVLFGSGWLALVGVRRLWKASPPGLGMRA